MNQEIPVAEVRAVLESCDWNPFLSSLADEECCVFKKCCKAYKKKGKHCKKCPKKD